jgi:hypothetical protein
MNRRECHGELRETHVGRPSAERAARKAQLEQLLDAPRTSALLQTAEDCYQQYVSLAAAATAGRQARHDTR